MTQQARNLGLDLADQGIGFLIGGRVSKWGDPFDEAFRSGGVTDRSEPRPAGTSSTEGG